MSAPSLSTASTISPTQPSWAFYSGNAATARYFKVLGDPTRLAIVQMLLSGERTVAQLTDALQLPQSRVSNHLACLRWCQVVQSERSGRSVTYRLNEGELAELLELAQRLAAKHEEHLASCSRLGPDWV